MDAPGPALSVVIPFWNAVGHVNQCIEAVLQTARPGTEVVVVDDGSDEPSEPTFSRFAGRIRPVRLPENKGFTAAAKTGVAMARGEFVCLLNSDAVVTEGALSTLHDWLRAHADYAAVAPLLLSPNGGPQPSCRRLPSVLDTVVEESTFGGRTAIGRDRRRRYLMEDLDPRVEQDVQQPAAACLMVRRTAYEGVGGLDPRMAHYFSDVDLSQRLHAAGLRTRYLPAAIVVHEGGVSTRARPDRFRVWQHDRRAYFEKHHGRAGRAAATAATALRVVEEIAKGSRQRVLGKAPERRALLLDLASFLAS